MAIPQTLDKQSGICPKSPPNFFCTKRLPGLWTVSCVRRLEILKRYSLVYRRILFDLTFR